ncbi:MAG: glycine cleavage system aminomethyltransferase GcvT [Acidobacteria bacterium]|nr:glycine cleavage system aminomethyltransferase GcvT [Acidobacteriota bacterium]MBS1866761.1 glycine cleavage system aminomethyltransferase GcvT [Acidobacteriota bacterium]
MDSVNSAAKTELRKTPLNALHRKLGAKMVNFGGWDMPVEYPSSGGLMAEHKAVRNGVGIFDVSHMGDIRIHTGKTSGGALAAVQHISMNDASKLAIGQAHYSAMLYPQGTFVDDVIVHRLGEDDYLLVINAGTREKDIEWVRQNTAGYDGVVEDLSDAYTQLAIQGPHAAEVLQRLTDANLSTIKNYWFTHGKVCGLPDRLIARTGYTGEDGFEIYIPSDAATSERVWNAVIEAGKEFGIVPCGLGARNTLRLEAKMALYEHEISDSINVFESGLDRYCKMEKGDFIGRAALAKASSAGLKRTLVGLETIERGIARDGYKVFDDAGEEIGVVTSGSPSPTLRKNIALAYVPPGFAAIGTIVSVEVRSQRIKAQVVPTPFYKRAKKAAPQAVGTA